MNPWLIYAWSQADAVRAALGIAGILIAGGGFLSIVTAWDFDHSPSRHVGIATVLGIVLGLVALALPSSRTIALMYVLPRVADSEAIQQDVPELYHLAVDALKAELSETAKGVKP